MRKTTVLLTGVALIIGLGPTQVAAHDHRPPRMNILTGTDRAKAERGSYGWSEKQGRFCSGVIADAFGTSWPRSVLYEMGDRIRFRFRKHHKPAFVKIRQYRDPDEHYGEGNGRRKYFDLAKVMVNGNVRWEARFELNRPGHHYFYVTAGWRDVDSCGFQNAEWFPHIRAVDP